MSIIIDGMDQAKTVLPHYERIPKYIDGKEKIHMHLNGVLVAAHNANKVPSLLYSGNNVDPMFNSFFEYSYNPGRPLPKEDVLETWSHVWAQEVL